MQGSEADATGTVVVIVPPAALPTQGKKTDTQVLLEALGIRNAVDVDGADLTIVYACGQMCCETPSYLQLCFRCSCLDRPLLSNSPHYDLRVSSSKPRALPTPLFGLSHHTGESVNIWDKANLFGKGVVKPSWAKTDGTGCFYDDDSEDSDNVTSGSDRKKAVAASRIMSKSK